MTTNETTVDLLALFAEVEAEHAAKAKADEAFDAKIMADYKAEKKAYSRMLKAAHARGEY